MTDYLLSWLLLISMKGSLSPKQRPVEWGKWIAKTSKGVRPYSSTPVIEDPLEFGMAIVKWWHSIQPAFRHGDALSPIAIYDVDEVGDVWAGLRKGGPNGLVSLLTLLVWWGQRADMHTQWQESSSPLWKSTVLDVTRCMEKMVETPWKRDLDSDGDDHPSKW
jgi:hypothetical protein